VEIVNYLCILASNTLLQEKRSFIEWDVSYIFKNFELSLQDAKLKKANGFNSSSGDKNILY